MVNKDIFVVSDIHGYSNELYAALREADFDITNPNHLLISCGDMFDRGENSVFVYEYLKRLHDEGKAIIIRGNHEKFLIEFLEGSILPFNYLYNGLRNTIGDFWHRTAPFESWCGIDKGCEMTSQTYVEWARECREDINEEYPELLPWLKSLPYYYETKNYIFTHGAIDTRVDDWHKPHCFKGDLVDWEALSFNDGGFFGEDIGNTDKTVVIGHFGTRFLREMYPERILDLPYRHNDDLLMRNDGRIIAIDATTVTSHKINVFKISDEELIDNG